MPLDFEHGYSGSKPRGTKPTTPTAPPPFDFNAVPSARSALDEALKAQATAASPGQSDGYAYRWNPAMDMIQPGSEQDYRTRTVGAPAESTVTPAPQSVDSAQSVLDEALRQRREAALGINGEPTLPIRQQVDRMSQAEYDALTPRARAAVDFNGMLVRAVRKDTKLQDSYDPTDQQQANYDAAVAKMFGNDAPAEMFAPETMRVLTQIGYQDQTAKLDDFLQLKAAIQASDLGALDQSGHVTELTALADPLAAEQSGLARTLATDTLNMQQQMAKSTQLLQSMNATAYAGGTELRNQYGGVNTVPQTMTGYGPAVDAKGEKTIDGVFQQAFEELANNKGSTRDEVYTALNSFLTPQEFQSFLDYADNRSAQAARYGVELGATDGVKYRTAEEFRKVLGLGKGG